MTKNMVTINGKNGKQHLVWDCSHKMLQIATSSPLNW